MQIKNATHEGVVCNYFFAEGDERDHYKNGSKIFFDEDTLFDCDEG